MREIDRLRADNRRLRKEMRRLSDREFRATRRAHSVEGRCVDVEPELKQCQARLLTSAVNTILVYRVPQIQACIHYIVVLAVSGVLSWTQSNC